jgi:hypothetical protein
MGPVAEMGNKNMGENSPESGGYSETRSSNYVSGYPIGSWDDSETQVAHFSVPAFVNS